MLNPRAPRFFDSGGQRQFVVEFGGEEVLDRHLTDDQHQPRGLHLLVGMPQFTQHFDPTTLKIIQVLGMVHATLPIDFVVADAKFQVVFHRGFSGDRRGSDGAENTEKTLTIIDFHRIPCGTGMDSLSRFFLEAQR
jgi:hypothetical protein